MNLFGGKDRKMRVRLASHRLDYYGDEDLRPIRKQLKFNRGKRGSEIRARELELHRLVYRNNNCANSFLFFGQLVFMNPNL